MLCCYSVALNYKVAFIEKIPIIINNSISAIFNTSSSSSSSISLIIKVKRAEYNN